MKDRPLPNPDAESEWAYRFRHFAHTGELQKAEPEQILGEGRLWCSSPRRFNDPFDCAPNFVMPEISIDRQIELVTAMIRRRNLDDSHPDAIAAIEAARRSDFNSPKMRAVLPRGMQSLIDSSSVCCFNSVWDDPRMWSQYADDHRGYCLGFLLDEGWPNDLFPQPIIYSDSRPEVDLTVDIKADHRAALKYVDDCLFTKSRHWESEREVRMVRGGVKEGSFVFPPESLRVVLLGIAISPENRDRLIRAARARTPPIKIYQLSLHPTHYAFEQHEIHM